MCYYQNMNQVLIYQNYMHLELEIKYAESHNKFNVTVVYHE